MKIPFLKSSSLSRRQIVRGALPVLALALIASVVTGRERPSDAVAEPAARIETRIDTQRIAAEDIDLSRLERTEAAQAAPSVDPFSRRSFAPAAPAQGQEANQAPARPEAPPLPFKYVGKMIDEGKLSVFVSRGDESYTLKPGMKLDTQYRVDKVTEDSVTFTYLPLKKKQELNLSAVN
jgi:hypothetical protein